MAGIGSAGRWSLLVAGLLALATSTPAEARKTTLTAADIGYIESDGPRPEGRILVRFELPEALRLGEVEFAVLELRTSVSADEGVSCVVVDAFPLTTEWDATTVSWDGAWGTPGGDFDRTEHAVWIARPGEDSSLRFDVTDMAADWASGTMTNHGVVLVVSPGWLGALGACDTHGAEPAGPTLLVYYTPHPELNR
jgi:hypothetical protein